MSFFVCIFHIVFLVADGSTHHILTYIDHINQKRNIFVCLGIFQFVVNAHVLVLVMQGFMMQ